MTGTIAGLPVVWLPDCLGHEPAGEFWMGVWDPGTEVPERASVLLEALTSGRPRQDQGRALRLPDSRVARRRRDLPSLGGLVVATPSGILAVSAHS